MVTGIAMQNGYSIGGFPILSVLAVIAAVVVIFVLILGRARRKEAGKYANATGARPASGAREQAVSAGHYAKRCPTCQSIYADETLAFCLSDGSTLERVPAPTRQRDPNATLVYADAPRSNLAPTVQSNPEEPPKS
ncbi:MAG TPA: hypothetical protein VN256_17640 [Pyrinomonadaceae bacterium]|nr:hypothetical protein [Pyrinomonadaceae bacterium]